MPASGRFIQRLGKAAGPASLKGPQAQDPSSEASHLGPKVSAV